MSSLALQIQRHIYNSAYVPRVRVMAKVSVRVRVIGLGLGLGKTNKTSNRCVFHTN